MWPLNVFYVDLNQGIKVSSWTFLTHPIWFSFKKKFYVAFSPPESLLKALNASLKWFSGSWKSLIKCLQYFLNLHLITWLLLDKFVKSWKVQDASVVLVNMVDHVLDTKKKEKGFTLKGWVSQKWNFFTDFFKCLFWHFPLPASQVLSDWSQPDALPRVDSGGNNKKYNRLCSELKRKSYA